MKFFFSCFLFLALGLTMTAQTTSEKSVDEVVAEYTTKYQLTAEQQVEMRQIEERRRRNLAEIQPFQATDQQLFWAKRKALRENTEGSVRRMLTPAQREIHDQELVRYRLETSNLIEQWRAEGKSKEEIEQLLLERG
ncbi:MAG: hypothetical protein KDC54_07155 [Lewinella sp.]|nr:hypothetical protein [Lewinella sp.]